MTDPTGVSDVVEGMIKMEEGKTKLSIVALLCATGLGVAALIIDGPQGEQIVTALVGLMGTVGGYLFGVKRCENAKEV